MAGLWIRLQSPLRDRRGRISPLKAATFALIVIVPTYAIGMPWLSDTAGGNPPELLTYTTGTWAAWLFLASLAITPARRIFGWTQLITIRRMLGVGAVAYTLAHIVMFLWLIRYDPAIFMKVEVPRPTIWVATASTLGLFVLAATSLDAAVAKMGKWWNYLHRASYVLIALGLLHFLLSRASTAGLPFVVAGVFFWLMAWRVMDYFGKGASLPWLFGLSIGTTAFSLGFQVVWLYFYRGRALLRTLTGEFTLGADFFAVVPGTFQLLIILLTVPMLGALFARPLRARRFVPVAAKPVAAAAGAAEA